MKYTFKCSDYDIERLDGQLQLALEKRIELYSRKKLPVIWNFTDKLNGAPKASKEVLERRRKRYKIYGIVNLALGFFLAIPGIMNPKDLKVPLITGIGLIILGIMYILPRKIKPKSVQVDAKKVLDNLQNKKATIIDALLQFDENGMYEKDGNVMFTFDQIDNVFISEDAYFFIWNNNIFIVQKKDITNDSNDEFISFLNRFLDNKVNVII